MEEMEAAKRTWWLAVVLAVVCLRASVAAQNIGTNVSDVLVLKRLQTAWGGGTSLWVGTDPCGDNWEGIICGGDRVIALNMVRMDLSGVIPSDIGDLDALQNLDISFNYGLSGELPTKLGSLSALKYLSLQQCRLSGEIPSSLGQLTNLTFFALNNNHFTGPLPSSLGALKNLKWFDVAYNNFTGPLPVSTTSSDGLGLDTWPVIEHYHLNNNHFSGNIPPELGNANQCVHMLLEVNNFVGPIPDTFGYLTNLHILSLHFNGLTGPVPSTLNKIIKGAVLDGSTTPSAGLHQIRLSNNSLTGTLPTLDFLDQLEYVDFSYNLFDPQPFPTWFNASLGTLQTIRLEGASLTGPLPDNILSYPSLQGLYLDSNQLNGSLTIPSDIGPSLKTVSLQNNKLSGFNSLNLNPNLDVGILLQGNPMCTNPGSFVTPDPKLCNTTDNPNITHWTSSLAVTNNCSVSFCSNARLTLNPIQCTCSYPLIVTLEVRAPTFSNIANDSLWSSLKDQTVQSLVNLSVSYVPAVKFESDQLWVRDAAFNGSQLRVDVRLFFFTLSGDFMDHATEGFITTSLTNQKVKYRSPFKPELVKEIDSSQALAPVVHSGLSKTAYIGIGVGAAVVCVGVGFLIFLAARMKRKAENERKNNPFAAWEKGKDGAAPKLKGATCFSFDEMKIMTNNFSEENTLGEGGYGKVYKGVAAGTGATIAVKRAQEGSKQGATEFKNEIELLSRVHHNNLVNLVGFCFDKSEQMLVYELMPNGTLTDWLRGSQSDRPLNWDRRLLIALGAARGLAYLHDNAEPAIVHRDVKSCNILLDRRMNAKVADFGLSVDNTGSVKTAIKGTMGYLDPDYYQTSMISPKIDVYSFGVVLLEILTGKPPIYCGNHIVKEVRNRFERDGLDGMREILDPSLRETLPEELETFTTIALLCVEDTALERPHMHEVVKQLENLVGPKAHLMPGAGGGLGVHSDASSMARRMARRERRIALRNAGMEPEFEMGSLGSPGSGSSQHSRQQVQSASFKYSGEGVAPPNYVVNSK